MLITIVGTCQYEDCQEDATHFAHSFKRGFVISACEKHATVVADEDYPEYIVQCPNCQCVFGV